MRSSNAGKGPLPLYFYCSRNAAEPERSNPDAVFGSILRQLSCVPSGKNLSASLIEKYKAQGKGFKSQGLSINDSRKLIVELVGRYPETIIVVDALDECDPDRCQYLFDAFESVLQESAGLVKIFVSSRDDQDIVHILRDYPILNISSSKNAHDIESFVRIETKKLIRKGRLLRNNQNREQMQAFIIDRICQGADGMLVAFRSFFC